MNRNPGVNGMLMEYQVMPYEDIPSDADIRYLFSKPELNKDKRYRVKFMHSQIDKVRAFARFEKAYGSVCKINKTIRDIEATSSGA